MTGELIVLLNDRTIGQVKENERSVLTFEYSAEWLSERSAIPLSLSMPLGRPRHEEGAIRPFMWGLLPDNEQTLESWGRRFGVSPRNPFALLGQIGEDLQGAIQMVPPARLGALRRREGVTALSRHVLAERLKELVRQPGATQFTEGGGQFSLAGAQPKKALYLVNGRWYEPRGRTPSTHILKPRSLDLPGQVENEAFCVRLAPKLNLPAPHIWVENFDGLLVVVIERYDRVRLDGRRKLALDQRGGEVRRVHQEDCCQALRFMPQRKYQQEGGPGIGAIMELLSGSSKPAVDRDRFMRSQAYNFVIGGSDAHAKNYGLLLSTQGRFRLAPLYDIISLLPYLERRRDGRLAMSVDGHYRFDQIMPRHWENQARSVGYNPDRAVSHVRDIIARLPDAALELLGTFQDEGLIGPELPTLLDRLTARCTILQRIYGSEVMAAGAPRLPGL